MDYQYWSWILGAVGVTGFFLAGKKVWWSWYINIFCQFLWFAYAIMTEQYGFFVASLVYLAVFIKNAVEWTKEHFIEKNAIPVQYEQITPEMREYMLKDVLDTEAIFQKRHDGATPWQPQDTLFIGSGKPIKIDEHPHAPRREPSVYPREAVNETMDRVRIADWADSYMLVHNTHVIRHANGWGYCIYCILSLQGDNREKLEAPCDGPPDR